MTWSLGKSTHEPDSNATDSNAASRSPMPSGGEDRSVASAGPPKTLLKTHPDATRDPHMKSGVEPIPMVWFGTRKGLCSRSVWVRHTKHGPTPGPEPNHSDWFGSGPRTIGFGWKTGWPAPGCGGSRGTASEERTIRLSSAKNPKKI